MSPRPPSSTLFPYTTLFRSFVPLAQASSLCGACKDACPVDIDLPKLLMRVRAGQAPLSGEPRSEEHTSELQSRLHLVCRLLLEKKKKNNYIHPYTLQSIALL